MSALFFEHQLLTVVEIGAPKHNFAMSEVWSIQEWTVVSKTGHAYIQSENATASVEALSRTHPAGFARACRMRAGFSVSAGQWPSAL